VSRLAVARARERLAGRANVRVERLAIPGAMPAGPFELIVCSEVLYYLTRRQALAAIAGIRAALAPGGSVLAVHRRAKGKSTPLYGEEVHELLGAHLGAPRALADSTALYRLERFDSAPGESAHSQ
jgi:hypothetical protein